MKNRLTIELRHKQLYKQDYDQIVPQAVVVTCNPDGTATYTPGQVPGQDWVDFTDQTEGLNELTLSWTASNGSSDESHESNEIGSNYQKGLSAELKFFGAAFQYIFDWLMTDPCQILNSIEVKITDLECQKTLRIFELKLDNIRYAPRDEPCIVAMPLRERDDVWHSFQKTIIEDDWQNWFNSTGTNGTKDHPTFGMIVEKKPKFFLIIYVVLIYVVGMLSPFGLLIAFDEGKRWIRRCLGFTYFAPGPLIRTYIENVCKKYGYTWDTIFDDDPANPYRDVCLFYPAGSTYTNFNESFDSPNTKFIWDNRTVLPFADLLDQLKLVFNAEWYATPNKKLVFKHKSYFDTQVALYDFTLDGADIIWSLEYNFNGKKKPAYGDYAYQTDPQDLCSPEIKWRYNSIVDYDGPMNNPMLEGHVTKDFEYAATAFHKDGTSKDFLEESIKTGRLVAVGAVALGLIELLMSTGGWTILAIPAIIAAGYLVVDNYVNDFFNEPSLNGMVRTSNAEMNVQRLLLWDRNSGLTSSKVVWTVNPEKNPFYNINNNDYYAEHPAFEAPGYFAPGSNVERIYNYPMYVDEKFKGNLYDRFHEYDNPLRNPTINQEWSGQVDLCCAWMDRLGMWQDDYIKIGAVVVLERRSSTRVIKGRIDEINVDYKEGRINLKGTVLK